MKKYLSLFVFASMLPFVQGSADDAAVPAAAVQDVAVKDVANQDGKIYVRPRAVRFMKKEIVVFTKNGVFKTPAGARDENGLFVNASDLQKVEVLAKGERKGKGCAKGCGKGQKKFGKGHNKFGKKHRMMRWKKWGSDQKKRRAENQPIAP